jgi:hypothetical protein
MPIHDWTKVPAGTFHDFHATWIPLIKRTLNQGVLPKGYYALTEQIASENRLTPDVLTLQAIDEAPESEQGGTAIAVHPPQVSVTAVLDDEVYARKANRIAIRHVSNDRVVAVVEVVSSGNKSSKRDFDDFVEKAISLLYEGIHLLIIDLQPPSPRDPHGIHSAIWQELGGPDYVPPPGKSLTLVSYVAKPNLRAFVEPIGIGDSLPPMPVILSPARYVDLPLEDSYSQAVEDIPSRARAPLDR